MSIESLYKYTEWYFFIVVLAMVARLYHLEKPAYVLWVASGVAAGLRMILRLKFKSLQPRCHTLDLSMFILAMVMISD